MSVGLPGALKTPEIRASAALSPEAVTQAGKAEDLPEATLGERYDKVDSTEEIEKKPGIK